jgi:hypothetical protein
MRRRPLFFIGLTAAVASAVLGASIAMADAAPAINADTATTTSGNPVTISPLANDTDPLGDLVAGTMTITVAPMNGSADLVPDTGNVIYTPNAGFAGTDSFSYQVCDDQATAFCGSAMVTISVNGEGEVTPTPTATEPSQPVTQSDSATTPSGTPVTIDVLANDEPGAYPFVLTSLSVVTPPADGSAVVDSATGLITYTPAAGFAGTDTFIYQACDSQVTPACAQGLVAVTVMAPAAATTATPTAAPATPTPTETATPAPVDTSTPVPADTSTPVATVAPSTPVSSTTAGANAVTTPIAPSTGSGVAAGSAAEDGTLLFAIAGVVAAAALATLGGLSWKKHR